MAARRIALIAAVCIAFSSPGAWTGAQAVPTPVGTELGRVRSPGRTALEIDSVPAGASVELDGLFVGYTPVTVDPVAPGYHALVLRKPGYPDARAELYAERDTVVTALFRLEAPTGILELQVDPPDAFLEADGRRVEPLPLEAQPPGPGIREYRLEAGERRLRVARFGYEADERVVSVPADGRTYLVVELAEAEFAVLSLEADPGRLAPLERGPRGRVRLRATISAPGEVTLGVRAGSDAPILVELPLSPSPRDPSALAVEWDGRDAAGAPLPDGDYLVVVLGSDAPGADRTAPVRIDSGYAGFPTTLAAGLAGPSRCPSPFADAPGSIRVAVAFALDASGSGLAFDEGDASIAVQGGERWALGVAASMGDTADDARLGGALSWAFDLPGPFSLSPRLRVARSGTTDGAGLPFDTAARYETDAGCAFGYGDARRWIGVSASWAGSFGAESAHGALLGGGASLSGRFWSIAASGAIALPESALLPPPSVAIEACVEPVAFPLALSLSWTIAFPDGEPAHAIAVGLSTRL